MEQLIREPVLPPMIAPEPKPFPKKRLLDAPVGAYTGFMRHWRLFDELESWLAKYSRGREHVSALVVGVGLERPLTGLDGRRPHLMRPMSFEPWELASVLEKSRMSTGTDWDVSCVEARAGIAQSFKSQRTVTLIPNEHISVSRRMFAKYSEGFLPGARKRQVAINEAEYGREVAEKLRTRAGLENVTVVEIPPEIRRRVNVTVGDIAKADLGSGRFDVALCLMYGDYISDEKEAVFRIISSLKPQGLLFTDRKVEDSRADHKFLRSSRAYASCYQRI
jgi:hypothetical protein